MASSKRRWAVGFITEDTQFLLFGI